jgi:hypothetical protein
MGLLGTAVLAIWNDIAPGGDAEFNHWHTREHIPERVGVPGFLRGRRYVAHGARAAGLEPLTDDPRYFTLYETESLATLNGPAYVERLNKPTSWTRRSLPLFRNTNRSACRVVLSLGQGIGGTLATLRIGPESGREEEFRAWLTGTTLPALSERPGVVGAHLCEADVDTTRVPTEEKKLRDQADAIASWVVMLEGVDAEIVEAACADFLNAAILIRHGAAPGPALGVYRLQYSLGR